VVEPIRRPVHSRPPSFGARFLFYQRNSGNLSKDRAALGQEIRKSVAELFDAALEFRTAIAIKGAPAQHAEGQPSHGIRTVSTARSRDVPAMHHHGTSGSRAAPVTLYLPGQQSQTHWSGAVRRTGFLVQSPLDTNPLRMFSLWLNDGLHQSLAWLVGKSQVELGVYICDGLTQAAPWTSRIAVRATP
jgi:hypothetical protein